MESAEVAEYTFEDALATIVECALERKEELEELKRERAKHKHKPPSPEAVSASLAAIQPPSTDVPTAAPPDRPATETTMGPPEDGPIHGT